MDEARTGRTEPAEIAGCRRQRQIFRLVEGRLFRIVAGDAVDLAGAKRTLMLRALGFEEVRQFGAEEQKRLAAIGDRYESGVSPGEDGVLVHFAKRGDFVDAVVPILLREARIGRTLTHASLSDFYRGGLLGRADPCLRPIIQIGGRIDRRPARLAVYRAAADNGEFG